MTTSTTANARARNNTSRGPGGPARLTAVSTVPDPRSAVTAGASTHPTSASPSLVSSRAGGAGAKPQTREVVNSVSEGKSEHRSGDPRKNTKAQVRRGKKTPAERRATRAMRYASRRMAGNLSESHKVGRCGNFVVGVMGEDGIRKTAVEMWRNREGTYLKGLETCAKIWLCPVCSAKIRNKRVIDIERAVDAHIAQGGGVEFLTLTLRHWKQHRLADTYDVQKAGWRFLWQGERGQALAADFGVFGKIRADEMTLRLDEGGNGWHPHLHVLVFTDAPWDAMERAMFEDRVFAVWSSHVRGCPKHEKSKDKRRACTCWRRGMPDPIRSYVDKDGIEHKPALTVVPVPSSKSENFSTYLTKVQGEDEQATKRLSSIGMEMGRGDLKRSTVVGGFTAFQMLDWMTVHDAAPYDCLHCRDFPLGARSDGSAVCPMVKTIWRAWGEYERATHKRRCIEWSKGLHAHFFPEGEVSDEDAAEEEMDDLDLLLASIKFEEWRAIYRAKAVVELMDLGERPTGFLLVKKRIAEIVAADKAANDAMWVSHGQGHVLQ